MFHILPDPVSGWTWSWNLDWSGTMSQLRPMLPHLASWWRGLPTETHWVFVGLVVSLAVMVWYVWQNR